LRAAQLLEPFLDATRYTAIAVVHGTGKRAPTAFDLCKQRMRKACGVVWLPDPALLDLLEGPNAKALRSMLAPKPSSLTTFASVKRKDVRHALSGFRALLPFAVDEGFLVAGQA